MGTRMFSPGSSSWTAAAEGCAWLTEAEDMSRDVPFSLGRTEFWPPPKPQALRTVPKFMEAHAQAVRSTAGRQLYFAAIPNGPIGRHR